MTIGLKKGFSTIILTLTFILSKLMAQTPELCLPTTHEPFVFTFTNDDRMLFTVGKKELRVWMTEGPYLLKSIPISNDSYIFLYVQPDNKKLIVTQGEQVRQFNLQTLEWSKTIWQISQHDFQGFSKNGKMLYFIVKNESTNDAVLSKINVETGLVNKVMQIDEETSKKLGADISLNNDETLLLSTSNAGNVLIDLKSKKVINTDALEKILFINDAGNLIIQERIKNSSDVMLKEVEPRSMKTIRSMRVVINIKDISEFDGDSYNEMSHNNRDRVLYEYKSRFWTVDLTHFTQSKRQEVKLNNDGFKLHQALVGGEQIIVPNEVTHFQSGDVALSLGGKFAFWQNNMTAFKVDDTKKTYQFGILPYQPFMLSDLSQGNNHSFIAGDRLVDLGLRDISFTQLPVNQAANFSSIYRYLPSQKRLFMNDVYFDDDREFSGPFVYDLKDEVTNVKKIALPSEDFVVQYMREYEALNTIIFFGSDRFVTLDTRTLKVKQEVKYGTDLSFEKSPLYQTNDNHYCALSPDNSKLIISLSDKDDKKAIASYNLTNKTMLWKYQSEDGLSNPVYTEGGKKVKFFNASKEMITLDAITGKVISKSALIPNASNTSFFSPTQKYVLNINYEEASDLGDIANFEVYDVATKKLAIELPVQRSPYIGAIFMANDRYLLTQDEDMKIWDLKNGKLVAEIILFHNNKDWILMTPDGRFDGSSEGLKQLYYVKGFEVIPLEQLYEGFYTPGLLKKIFDGEGSDGEDIKNIKSPPIVKIGIPTTQRNLVVEDDKTTIRRYKMSSDKISLTVEATSKDDAVTEIRLFHNGKIVGNNTRNLVVEDEKPEKIKSQTFDIQLLEGENIFKAIAINSQRTESKPDEIAVTFTSSQTPVKEEVQLHIIIVGINQYKNAKYNLNYALADATSFKEAIEKKSSSIFSKVNMTFIKDENATKANINTALENVKTNATAKDVFIFYYAGHGVMNDKKEFYLVPHDVTQIYGADESLSQKGFGAKLLQQFSKEIKAQKQLFILDACQSAAALENVLAARGAAEEKAIAQLARATGTYWLAASGSEQFASEFVQLGHGSFTYSLLEALNGKADTGDKKITVKEIDNYLQERVPEVTAKYKGTPQYPSSYGYGNDFPIGVVKQ